MREEGGEEAGELRIDLDRVIVDPDYRQRVLARLRAERHASAAPILGVPSPDA